MNKKLPEWGKLKVENYFINYVHATLDGNINPKISAEDLRAVSDYPAIYIYVSRKQDDGNRFFYIGQTISVSKRVKQHEGKIDYDLNNRFNKFINGDYYIFYSEDIENNLNHVEMLLIRMFYREFNIFNFINLNQKIKNGTYINNTLANKTFGNDSGKYQEKRDTSTKLVNKILEKLKEDGVIKNDYKLRNHSSLFSSSPFFDLTETQEDILNKILKRNKEKGKKVSIVEGEPGTGKTVLLLHLIAALKNNDDEYNICLILRPTQRKRFKQILQHYGLDPNKSGIDIITFHACESKISTGVEYNVIIVDESQRTTKITENGIYPTGSKSETDTLKKIGENSVIDYLHKHTNHLIMTYDDNQRLRNTDKENNFPTNINLDKYKLKAQLRVLNGGDIEFANTYIDILKKLLFDTIDDKFYENLKTFKEKNIKNNYIKIARDYDEWFNYIKDKHDRFNLKKSVFLSGLCKSPRSADAFHHINHNLLWSKKGEEFRDYNKNNITVGNVYDIQGFDIDFAAVYIGKDIFYNKDKRRLEINKSENKDSQLKRGQSEEKISEFIKKSYYVLLTRAVYGQIIYIEDDRLRDLLLN